MKVHAARQASSRRDRRRVALSFQGELVQVRCVGGSAVGGGVRGRVSGFSSGSRRRLLKQLARANLCGGMSFVTLTYHLLPDAARVKRDLKVFIQRLKVLDPRVCGWWRMEPQKRGVPHFHLLLSMKYIPQSRMLDMWRAVTGQPSIVAVWVEHLKSGSQARGYVAKYAAKVEDVSLDNDAYWTDVGRRWGVIGRDLIDWSHDFEFLCELGPWFYAFRRCLWKVYRPGRTNRFMGGSVFTRALDDWLVLFGRLVGSDCIWGSG